MIYSRMVKSMMCHILGKGRKYWKYIRRELLAICFCILIIKMKEKSCKFSGVASICFHTIWISVSCQIPMSRFYRSKKRINKLMAMKILRMRAWSSMNAFNSKVYFKRGPKSSNTRLPFLTITEADKIWCHV